jgi:heptosyltransferase II
MKLLCICPIGIGNYLMCYPAFAALKRHRPGISLHMLALRHAIAAMANGDPLWEGVHAFDPDKIKDNVAAPVKALVRLRGLRFDASLCFFPSNTWQYFAFPLLCGIRRRYGFRYQLKRLSSLSFLATDSIAVDPSLHDVVQNLRLSGFFLGENIDGDPVTFPRQFGDDDAAWAADCRRSLAGDTRLIAIHPGSSIEHGMDVKRWPAERFAALADKACTLAGAHALIVGSADESDVKRAVAAGMREPSHVVEPVSIRKTAALLSKCDCCICNDSGIMHMAACMGVPTAGIFGPTDEKRNGPFGERNLVIRKPMPGFPLFTAGNVGDRSLPAGIDPKVSLRALTAEEAWERLQPWLANVIAQSP